MCDTTGDIAPWDCAWKISGGKCLILGDTLKSWSNAEATCIHQGGHLVSVYDVSKQTEVENFLQHKNVVGVNIWTGGKETNDTTWKWIEGTCNKINLHHNHGETDIGACT